jgi:hypothetical protein
VKRQKITHGFGLIRFLNILLVGSLIYVAYVLYRKYYPKIVGQPVTYTPSSSMILMQCRICFEEGGRLVSPCSCRGSSAYIHPHCLERYVLHYPDRVCRVCNETMKTYITGYQVLKFSFIYFF